MTLEIPNLEPVEQMQIGYIFRAADGTELRQTMHTTINKVPGHSSTRR